MREIKFRAWDGQKWRNDFTLDHDGSIRLTDYCGDGEPNKVVDWKLVQYIGIKDKNGVEIYEGDIVNANSYWNAAIIEYFPPQFLLRQGNSVCDDFELDHWVGFEVVGNIYESPELLEAE